jgi:hypothetical protein
MTITTAITDQAKLDALSALCPAGNTYKMALYTSAATLDKTTTVYSTTNEVVGTGYTAGGATLAGYAASLSGDTAILTFTSPTWASSSISADGCVIYDATNANKVRAVYSFGGTITSTNGTFTAQIPTADATNALIRLA